MKATKLNFECTHNQADGTMTCSWLDGRVKLVEHFKLEKTYVLVDGEVKCRHDDVTIDEFIRLQCECQRVADGMKGDKRDLMGELRLLMQQYIAKENELITTKPGFREGDMENYSDSYKYLLLQVPDEQIGTPEEMISLGVQDFPNDVLAGILWAVLKNALPKGVDLKGLSIDRIGRYFHFCISGSTSLEVLQKICEQQQQPNDQAVEK